MDTLFSSNYPDLNFISVLIFADDGTLCPGTAAHNLISLLSKGLSQEGCHVTVSRIAPQLRKISYLRRAFSSLIRIRKASSYDIVIYYGHAVTSLLLLGVVCAFRRSLIPYVVEWPIAIANRNLLLKINDILFCSLVFRVSQNAIVISRFLEKIAKKNNHSQYSVLRVPVLCDISTENTFVKHADPDGPRIITYCANLSSYFDDARLVIESVSRVGIRCELRLIGQVANGDKRVLERLASKVGLKDVVFMSNLSRSQLFNSYLESDVLIAPLANDKASIARFPSKLADYLVSGRPVVVSAFGEPSFILENLKSAYIAKSHSPNGYAEALSTALLDPKSIDVGKAGRLVAIETLGYLRHCKIIRDFFQRSRRFKRI